MRNLLMILSLGFIVASCSADDPRVIGQDAFEEGGFSINYECFTPAGRHNSDCR